MKLKLWQHIPPGWLEFHEILQFSQNQTNSIDAFFYISIWRLKGVLTWMSMETVAARLKYSKICLCAKDQARNKKY